MIFNSVTSGGGGSSLSSHTVTVTAENNAPSVFFNDDGYVNVTSEPTNHTAGEVVVFLWSQEDDDAYIIGASGTVYEEPTQFGGDIWAFVMPDEDTILDVY